MKKSIFIIGLFTSLFLQPVSAKNLDTTNDTIQLNAKHQIKDGMYDASVTITSDATYAFPNTYKLRVQVINNEVVSIGSGYSAIRAGYNDRGYIYEGGGVSLVYNEEGHVIAATATVTTSSTGSNILYMKILIK